ncbi:MAG: GNAT family N-acetyltransferase, partial [Candidatus Altiarchaeales archaeon]|nr:GNAT family N-acetyltransferase [Candidatus Altiarchaeales archaeon]
VEAGIKASNLGQLVYDKMGEKKVKCKCIRCREVGRFLLKGVEPAKGTIELVRRDYRASNGKEIFLSFEDRTQDLLIGFLRLRIPYKPFMPEITPQSALVRELHVYGPMLELGEKPEFEWQHRGYGKELLAEAEKIARKEFNMKQIIVTSGIGARNYYKKFKYKKIGVYMGKTL